jgi:multiple sugar transport system permease protein
MSVLAASRGSLDRDREPFRPSTWLLVTPATILLVTIFLVPIVIAFYLAFTNLQLLGPNALHPQFTGLANAERMVADPVFVQSVGLTILFIVSCALIGQTVAGLALALLMQRSSTFTRATVSTIALVGWALPEVTVAFAWYAFAQAGGVLGGLLQSPTENYLTTWPFVIVSIANVWHTLAFSMLIFLAGLRNVPPQLLEAAALEGTSYFGVLRRVTFPLLRPVFVTSWLVGIVQNISVFTLIYVMTQGGPNNATMTLPVYIYQQSFTYYELGYGSAIALVLLVIGGAFGVFFVRNQEARR